VGNPAIKGTAVYNKNDQTYLLSASGKNIWAKEDQFHFVFKKIKGDFIIKATVRFTSKGVDGHRKLGVMARNKLTTGSTYIDGAFHGGQPFNTSMQFREKDDDTTGQLLISPIHPTEIELERSGDMFTFSAAVYGENYRTVSKKMNLDEEAFVGLFLCAHNEAVVETAEFSNVRVIFPPKTGWVPYQDYIGSHLEVMDVATGKRKILHSASNSLQAPNWTTDNKSLLYSSDGLLYRYDLKTSAVSKINTGTITDLNNDHVLSMDGKMIGLSNHLGSRSVIYIMPVEGSDAPVQITTEANAPSYLHGWSPDKKTLIFTGQRKGQWDIVAIDIATKKETSLTDHPALNDGSEYSPDGKYIYFNSARTGTMKIWRMKRDGSNPEQVTFDEMNDWFPHFSPDGKWIVYLSFPKDIDPTSHPFYQKVYLRLIPATGGVPKNIAYVFGGQGTINVPSWSPDSKQIAFISNSQIK
jgi:Tol biopolymer transport system component